MITVKRRSNFLDFLQIILHEAMVWLLLWDFKLVEWSNLSLDSLFVMHWHVPIEFDRDWNQQPNSDHLSLKKLPSSSLLLAHEWNICHVQRITTHESQVYLLLYPISIDFKRVRNIKPRFTCSVCSCRPHNTFLQKIKLFVLQKEISHLDHAWEILLKFRVDIFWKELNIS